MRFFNALPGAVLPIVGCIVMGFGIKAAVAHANRGSLSEILFGIFILTIGSFFATVGYLAPKYGTKVGRRYYFDNDSPMALFIPLGIVFICLEGGVLYWIAR